MSWVLPKRVFPLLPWETDDEERRYSAEPGLYSAVNPEVEKSILDSILSSGGSAIAMLGGALDTPGAIARGGIQDLMDAIQGNEYQGKMGSALTDWDSRVSGRNLLENAGLTPLIGEDSKNWVPDFGDWLGLQVEILTDPTSYMTMGANTLAGKAAQRAGAGAKTLSGAIKQGEKSLVGLGLPFMEPMYHLGTDVPSQNFAKGLDTLWEKARYGKVKDLTGGMINWDVSPGQRLASLFGKWEAHTPEVGRAAQSLNSQIDEADQVVRDWAAEGSIDRINLGLTPEQNDAMSVYLRSLVERREWSPDATSAGGRLWSEMDAAAKMLPKKARDLAEQIAGSYRTLYEDTIEDLFKTGEQRPPLVQVSGHQYAPRYASGLPGSSPEIGRHPQFEEMAAPTEMLRAAINQVDSNTSAIELLEKMPVRRLGRGKLKSLGKKELDTLITSDPEAISFNILEDVLNSGHFKKFAASPHGSIESATALSSAYKKEFEIFDRAYDHALNSGSAILPDTNLQRAHDVLTEIRAEAALGKQFGIGGRRRTPATLGPLASRTSDELKLQLLDYAKKANVPVHDMNTLSGKALDDVIHEQRQIIEKYTGDQVAQGLFGRDFMQDAETGLLSLKHRVIRNKFMIEQLGKHLKPSVGAIGDSVRLGDALKRLGLENPSGGVSRFVGTTKQHADPAAMQSFADLLNTDPSFRGMPLQKLHELAKGPAAKLQVVPEWLVSDLERMFRKSNAVEVTGTIRTVFDPLMNLFKGWTLTWPGRWPRDLLEGQLMNIAAGHSSVNAARDAINIIAKGEGPQDWKAYMKNPTIAAMAKSYSKRPGASQVYRAIQSLIRSTDLLSSRQGIHGTGDLVGKAQGVVPLNSEGYLSEIVGQDAFSWSSIASQGDDILDPNSPLGLGSGLNPFNVRGFPKTFGSSEIREQTGNKILAAGEKIGQYSDQVNRLVPFLDMLRDGYDPIVAKNRVDALQVNYRPESFSRFERDYMKRLFPFYSFSRRMVPQVAGMLAQKPGGVIGQIIRTHRIQEEGSYDDPERSVPVGAIGVGIPGTEQVLRGFGNPADILGQYLPDEQALRGGVTGTVEDIARTVGSQLRPEIKVPIEAGTGISLFFNEPIEDVYRKPTNWTLANMVLQGVAPRASTTINRLTSDNPVNALLGGLTGLTAEDATYNAGGQREMLARDIGGDMLDDTPFFRKMEVLRPQRDVDKEEIPDYLRDIFRTEQTIRQRHQKERRAEQKKREFERGF